jgi:uncharacterized protein YjbI with pentapeptide repeats
MADQEQVNLIKQGAEVWNKWRNGYPFKNIRIDLYEADLRGMNLRKANLWGADLREANLQGVNLQEANLLVADIRGSDLRGANLRLADLSEANLREALLGGADLSGANLKRTDLWGTNLWGADLNDANLREADFHGADLRKADLRGSVLSEANLINTELSGTKLKEAKFGKVVMGWTNLGDVDLSEVKGLESVVHVSSSILGTDTIKLSKGKIPEKFLRGCGLDDREIESVRLYQPGLSEKEVDDILYRIHDLMFKQALQINPLFISYSHADGNFVDAMEKHLDEKGIRFWRDIHDMTAGKIERVIDTAIRQNPIFLLILSENSVKSDWVEHETRKARELEKQIGRDVICPVALDEAWKDCRWPERLREQIMEYNIMDFSKWKDKEEFGKKFEKLIQGLDIFYREN